MKWHEEGEEPDYRFSLANERTFLAWSRTALALLAGGVALHQFALHVHPQWAFDMAAALLAVLSGLLGAGAYVRWKSNEIAMRNKRPLPRTWLMPLLAGSSIILSVFAIFVFGVR